MNRPRGDTMAIASDGTSDLKRRITNYLQQRLPTLDGVEIETQNGSVILRGLVPSQSVRQRCLDACRHVAGVLNVVDQLVVIADENTRIASEATNCSKERLGQVLLIDDSSDVTFIWDKLLTKAGYGVRVARTGNDGLAAAKESSFDTICIDLRLPDMSGYDLANRLRHEVCTSAPIIAISGSIADPDEAAAAGIDLCLLKPVKIAEILSVIAAPHSAIPSHH